MKEGMKIKINYHFIKKMVDNILFNTVSAKIGSTLANVSFSPSAASEKFISVLRYQCTDFIIFNIPMNYGNKCWIFIKTDISVFVFSLSNSNIGRSRNDPLNHIA